MKTDFAHIKRDLLAHGIATPEPLHLRLSNARSILEEALRHFIGSSFVWIAEYDEVASWLADNEGRGLLLYGLNGNGKTVLCQRVLPAILLHYHRKVVSCYDYSNINSRADEALSKRLASVDDIGNEEQALAYGNRRWVVPELLDMAEKRGNILLLTTNFTRKDLADKYGTRSVERLIAVTKRVQFTHKSFRK